MFDVIANLAINFIALVVFLFIFWKKLKEDYVSEMIFSSAFIILGFSFFGYLISFKFFPRYFFWAETIGFVLGLLLSVYKHKLRFYETFEASVVSLFPWLLAFFLHDSAKNSSIVSLIAFFVILLLILIYYFIDLKYKNFTWYRSGRVGLSGLMVTGLFFLIRASVSIFFSGVLSFAGKAEIYLSAFAAFLSFILIYNLGRKYE